jgi:hypothetical protein
MLNSLIGEKYIIIVQEDWIIPTSCSRVLHEKLRVAHLVKKFPAFYWNRLFIIVFVTGPYSEPV